MSDNLHSEGSAGVTANDGNCLNVGGKTAGEKFEGIAFTFCKAATIILLTQKFALPIASGAAAVFYILAYALGKKDTCCWLKWPPLIAGFWGLVCLISTYLTFNPAFVLPLPFLPH
jgi:hypothetical protein